MSFSIRADRLPTPIPHGWHDILVDHEQTIGLRTAEGDVSIEGPVVAHLFYDTVANVWIVGDTSPVEVDDLVPEVSVPQGGIHYDPPGASKTDEAPVGRWGEQVTCGSCRYADRGINWVDHQPVAVMRCRRLPPSGDYTWPLVAADDRCGEYQPA